jgi:cobyrinic acid a,c-diamide synthase
VLVVDAWAMARSAAAVLKGFCEFDPGEESCACLSSKATRHATTCHDTCLQLQS